jgi:NAD+ kinase
MPSSIQQVLIAAKRGVESAGELSKEMADWLAGRGVKTVCYENKQREESIPGLEDSDLVVVLGGDGTMISVARRVMLHGVPMLGMNMGKVGFLSDMELHDWKRLFAEVLKNGLGVTERLALEFDVVRAGQAIYQNVAVNDVVVNRGSLARLITLGLYLDGEHVGEMRSDGLIVSTPNGSTAYSISAGGPVLHPELDAVSVTHICPFLHHFHPIVVPGGTEITVEVVEDRAQVFLTQDGQLGYRLHAGDKLVIRKHSPGPRFVKAPGSSYIRKLRLKRVLE